MLGEYEFRLYTMGVYYQDELRGHNVELMEARQRLRKIESAAQELLGRIDEATNATETAQELVDLFDDWFAGEVVALRLAVNSTSKK